MAEQISDKIKEDALVGIQEVTVDGTTVEAMTVDDRIKADQYAKQGVAATKNHLGNIFRQIVPGGTG